MLPKEIKEEKMIKIREKIKSDDFRLVVSSEPETYMQTIENILSIAQKEGVYAVFVTFTRPYISLREEFEKKNLDLKKIFVIDCITMLGNPSATNNGGVAYVPSPTALEEIVIQASRTINKYTNERLFFMFDSITTAGIYLSENEIERLIQTIFVKCTTEKRCGCIVLAPKLLNENTVVRIIESLGAERIE